MKKVILLAVIVATLTSCMSKEEKEQELKEQREHRNHNIRMVWIGTDEEIPKDGSLVEIKGTNNQIVYVGNIVKKDSIEDKGYLTKDE